MSDPYTPKVWGAAPPIEGTYSPSHETVMPSEELKPCPFCGVKATDAHIAGSAWFIDADHAPDCFFADFQRTEAEAIAAWNARAPVEGLREALEAAAATFGRIAGLRNSVGLGPARALAEDGRDAALLALSPQDAPVGETGRG